MKTTEMQTSPSDALKLAKYQKHNTLITTDQLLGRYGLKAEIPPEIAKKNYKYKKYENFSTATMANVGLCTDLNGHVLRTDTPVEN